MYLTEGKAAGGGHRAGDGDALSHRISSAHTPLSSVRTRSCSGAPLPPHKSLRRKIAGPPMAFHPSANTRARPTAGTAPSPPRPPAAPHRGTRPRFFSFSLLNADELRQPQRPPAPPHGRPYPSRPPRADRSAPQPRRHPRPHRSLTAPDAAPGCSGTGEPPPAGAARGGPKRTPRSPRATPGWVPNAGSPPSMLEPLPRGGTARPPLSPARAAPSLCAPSASPSSFFFLQGKEAPPARLPPLTAFQFPGFPSSWRLQPSALSAPCSPGEEGGGELGAGFEGSHRLLFLLSPSSLRMSCGCAAPQEDTKNSARRQNAEGCCSLVQSLTASQAGSRAPASITSQNH